MRVVILFFAAVFPGREVFRGYSPRERDCFMPAFD